MDSRTLDALRTATSIELYELSLALDKMLADPKRILDVRRHLHLGAPVMFLEGRRGTLVPGRVLQLQPTYALIQDSGTGAHWKLPYPAIVVDPDQRLEQTPPPRPRPADTPTFKVGDTVGFSDKHLRERIGVITRMNTRTYSILCGDEQWRVSPQFLRKIIDL